MSDDETPVLAWVKPLDPTLYAPAEEEKAFMKATTGFEDDGELKRHIIDVQVKAFELYRYPCIRIFEFISLKIVRRPAYPQLLQLLKEREDAVFLDMGCCFGNDLRKVVLDGWPVEHTVASDLSGKLWDLGHEPPSQS